MEKGIYDLEDSYLPSLFPAFALFSAALPLLLSPPLGQWCDIFKVSEGGKFDCGFTENNKFSWTPIQAEALYNFTGAYVLMFICYPTMCQQGYAKEKIEVFIMHLTWRCVLLLFGTLSGRFNSWL